MKPSSEFETMMAEINAIYQGKKEEKVPWNTVNELYRHAQKPLDQPTASRVLQLLNYLEDRDPKEFKEGEFPILVIPTTLEMRGDAFVALGKKEEAKQCYLLALQLLGNVPQGEGQGGRETVLQKFRAKIEALS